MDILLAALSLLGMTATLSALSALLPLRYRHMYKAAPFGIMVACLLGFAGIFSSPFTAQQAASLPWALPFGSGALALDALSRIFLLPVFGLGFVCAFSGWCALRHYSVEEHNMDAHWFFFTMLVLALCLVCTARDAIFFLLAWEVMSLSPFFLIEFNDTEAEVREASWVYLVAAHLGALFLLVVFALLWRENGSTAFGLFALDPQSSMATAIFLLAVLGFGAKAGLAPLHVWLPEAHPAAPSHVSALLSGAMINAGLYGIYRLLDFFPQGPLPAWWGWLLLGLGLSTALVGILKASAQANLKRLLAYSSVENMGIMLMGCGTGLVGMSSGNTWIALLGFSGSLMHMLNHASFKGLLFLCAGEVLHTVHSVRLDTLGGLQKRLPLVGAAFAVGAASIACLPPFNGFAGEFLLALGLANGLSLPHTESTLGLMLALTGLALVSGLAAATYIKAYGVAFLGEPRTGAARNAHAPEPWELLPLLPLALACLALGLGAGGLLPLVSLALPLPPEAWAEHMPTASGLLSRIALLGAAGIGLTLALLGLRLFLLRGDKKPTHHPTWGCGFQKGTARIQYSGASFTEPSSRFLGPLMGLKVRKNMDPGYFPAKASLEVQSFDRVRQGIFTPLFEGILRLCDALKIIQHGRIHLYILYMLLTVVALLVWGLHA